MRGRREAAARSSGGAARVTDGDVVIFSSRRSAARARVAAARRLFDPPARLALVIRRLLIKRGARRAKRVGASPSSRASARAPAPSSRRHPPPPRSPPRGSSPSSSVEIVGEVHAAEATSDGVDEKNTASSNAARERAAPGPRSADPVRAVAAALSLRPRRVQGRGNCMFCAFALGLAAFRRETGSLGPIAEAALASARARRGAAPTNASSEAEDVRDVDVTWADLRAVLARRLRGVARAPPGASRDAAMATLTRGDEGRRWLREGALALATASERFERYAAAMAADAAPHAGTRRWTRHWGADVEATALAEALNVAVVCVETADRSNPTDDRSRRTEPKMYLGVPSAFAEREGNETRTHSTNQRRTNERRTNERLRLGRYLPRGRLLDGGPPASAGAGERKMKLGAAGSRARAAWTSARGGVRLTVALVPASSRAARIASGGAGGATRGSGSGSGSGSGLGSGSGSGSNSGPRRIPALAMVHRPGHFDALVAPRGYALVLEREEGVQAS